MVARMKKFTFLIYHKEYETFLDDLRDLGLVHVVENKVNQEENENLEVFNAQFKKLSEAKKALEKRIDKKNPVELKPSDAQRGWEIPGEIEKIQNDITLLSQQLQVSRKERDALYPWGNFDPELIAKLKNEGYFIDFFVAPDNIYNPEWEELYNAVVINQQGSRKYFITVSKENNVAELIHLDPIKIPEISMERLNQLIDDLERQKAEKEEELTSLVAYLPSLDAALKEIQLNIDYTKVTVSANPVAGEKVMLLQGYAPEEKQAEIEQYLQSKNAYFEVADPEPEDDVPIQFKNNRFTRLFEPLAEMYMLPRYNELDLTPFFAPFYMIFFGLSLGDIGYGLFLFAVATIYKLLKKEAIGKTMRGVLTLVQILGASAFFTGFLTGGFFGFQLYDLGLPFLNKIGDRVFFDNNQMFTLSLILGVVQILFGMVLKAINRAKQYGFMYALATIGWIILLVSIGVAYLLPKTMPMFGTLHLIVMGAAAILIFFFNSPGKNPFFNLGLGLWDSYNMATGLLGDVLSYVRLFALGLSGGILASVFNSLAAGIKPDNAILGPIVFVLIFLIGHGLTIFMNTLGAIVHPMRLTFVEFYKNSEFTGGGKKYSPFSK